MQQKTIAQQIELKGYGVHSGQESVIICKAAPPDSGVVFFCNDILINATLANVYNTKFCTGLREGTKVVNTIEHLLSAICGCDIDNMFIELIGSEIPIMDGSALVFAHEFIKAGIIIQQSLRDYIVIKEHIRVEDGDKYAEFLPYDGTCYDVTINFPNKIISHQHIVFDKAKDDYIEQVALARTFGFLTDAKKLWKQGLALGASLENSIIIDENDSMVNLEGLRIEGEFVRHKLLDLMGDSFLLGKYFKGKLCSYCSGHALNIKLVEKLIKSV